MKVANAHIHLMVVALIIQQPLRATTKKVVDANTQNTAVALMT